MKTVFFSALMSVTLVNFDTQDNIHQVAFQTPCNEWTQTNDLDTWQPAVNYGLRREMIRGQHGVRFKSTEPVKMIKLDSYPYSYKVKKISPYEFEVRSRKFNDYFDGTDMLKVVVKLK